MKTEAKTPFQSMECSRKGQWRHIIGWSKLKGISMYTQSLPGGSPYQPACRNMTKNWHKQQICSLWWEYGIFVNSVFCGHNHRLTGGSRKKLWWSRPLTNHLIHKATISLPYWEMRITPCVKPSHCLLFIKGERVVLQQAVTYTFTVGEIW